MNRIQSSIFDSFIWNGASRNSLVSFSSSVGGSKEKGLNTFLRCLENTSTFSLLLFESLIGKLCC